MSTVDSADRITDNTIGRLVEANTLVGTESFPSPAVLTWAAYVDQLLSRINLPEVILLS